MCITTTSLTAMADPRPEFDDKTLCFVSSQHSTRTDDSSFTANIGGNMLNAKKIVRLTPKQIFVPNIFPNIKAPYNTFTIQRNADPVVTITIAPGQYSIDGVDYPNIETTINTAILATSIGADLEISYSTVQSLFSFVSATGDTLTITVNKGNIGQPLGFDVVDSFQLIGAEASKTADAFPDLGGERVVLIKCTRLAPNNMVHFQQSSRADILFTVPLHNTVYGNTACYTPGDHIIGDVVYERSVQTDLLEFQLLDSELRPLTLPFNWHVHMCFKIHHLDG